MARVGDWQVLSSYVKCICFVFRVTIQKVPITTYLDPFADQDDEEIYLSEYEFSIDPKVRRVSSM